MSKTADRVLGVYGFVLLHFRETEIRAVHVHDSGIVSRQLIFSHCRVTINLPLSSY